ncbi:MAG: serine/threonine protein kinase [Pseudomonadota bacterium]
MSSNLNELPQGTRFKSSSGSREGEVGALLGAGGQGAVYSAHIDGGQFALKWYHPTYASIDTDLLPRLTKAVSRGAPDQRFLWPMELVNIPGAPSFGYIMPIRPGAYVGMKDLIAPPPRRLNLSLDKRATVCRHIAHCFLELHASGFCYQDINFGNIFLNPETADVMVCDNDNVNVDGAPASIYGTRKFMAPEVVRRETLPSTATDLFSMAVMFFYVMFSWHPLDGKAENGIKILDADAEMRLYGTDPVFLFDPQNTSNGPVEGMHDAIVYRWESISEALRGLFTRAFTRGLSQPSARVHEHEWRTVFDRLITSVYQCTQCGYENVLDDSLQSQPCSYCKTNTSPPPALQINSRTICLSPNRIICTSHLIDSQNWADSNVAEVTAHPDNPDIIGLKNISAESWRAEIPGYSATLLEPGKTVRIVDGLILELGQGAKLSRGIVTHNKEGAA